MNPEVGQTVYLVPGINTARDYGNKIQEGIIKTLGRKYITVTLGFHDYQFEKESLRQKTEYTPDYHLYFERQRILDERETEAIRRELHQIFSTPMGVRGRNLTLDQLRRIKEIIGEGE